MKIMCLGDSLTFGCDVDPQDNWVSLTARKTGWTLVNKGINGDTTGGMLARFRPELADDKKTSVQNSLNPAEPYEHNHCRGGTMPFDAVLTTGGTNDVFATGSTIAARANMAAVCRQAIHLGLQPMVGVPTPMDLTMVDPAWGEMIPLSDMMKALTEYRQWLLWFEKSYGVPVIDFWGAFPDPPTGLFLPDGLHPNAAGHQLMAEALTARLPEIFSA